MLPHLCSINHMLQQAALEETTFEGCFMEWEEICTGTIYTAYRQGNSDCTFPSQFIILVFMPIPTMTPWEYQYGVSKWKFQLVRLGFWHQPVFVPTGTSYTILWRRLLSCGELRQWNPLQIIISGLPADTLPEARAARPAGTVPFLLSRFSSYTGKRKKKKRWSWAKWSSATSCHSSLSSCAFLGWAKRNCRGPDRSPISPRGGPGPSAAGCGTSSLCWRSTWGQTLSTWER